MTEVTRLLEAAHRGDRQAAADLLPLVYDELRRLAAAKLVREKPGQTLNATALVHEAYLRMVEHERPAAAGEARWEGRGHFYAAAAEAMPRILVERARHKATRKRGGALQRVDLDQVDVAAPQRSEDLLALDEALSQLESHDA